MKIAVSGKGGVGKTTVSATLAHLYAQESRKVIQQMLTRMLIWGLPLAFRKKYCSDAGRIRLYCSGCYGKPFTSVGT